MLKVDEIGAASLDVRRTCTIGPLGQTQDEPSLVLGRLQYAHGTRPVRQLGRTCACVRMIGGVPTRLGFRIGRRLRRVVHHHPHNAGLVCNRVEKVAQKVRANVLLGDVVPDERKQRIEPHQIGFVLRHKQAHGVGKLLTRLDGLGDDHKALLQGHKGIVRAFDSQSRQTSLKHFRDVSYVVFGLHDQRL